MDLHPSADRPDGRPTRARALMTRSWADGVAGRPSGRPRQAAGATGHTLSGRASDTTKREN
ncbi:hypothetical protein J2S55_006311 [Streptosporangium brasiliense]|uniref:Uncharacterized protein n=1 Tax=Streptosporangium brasiliense TaxID=47480 RepID=A0ABT9RCS3_9ACTN|nr:hypothetical protein [Streptosporangium brasiliense]